MPRNPGKKRALAVVGLLLLTACGAPADIDPETASVGVAEQDASPLELGAQGGVESTPSSEPEPDALIRHGSAEAERLGLAATWTGDLDGMIERGVIRALVPYGKTTYFLDGLKQRGTSYELLKVFEDWVNERHASGALRIHVVPIPAARDELLRGVVEGRADLALGGLTITARREELVDFSDPIMKDVSEILVTSTANAGIRGVEDLAGKPVYVRESSSYYDSLLALNESLRERGLEPANLVAAPEDLEDEDLLEMVNAGIVDTIVVDQYKAEFWNQIFDDIVLHPDVAVRTGGEMAWAFREDSPQLAELVNGFMAKNRKGTLVGNMMFNRYLKDASYIRNVMDDAGRERFRSTAGLFEQYAAQYGFEAMLMVAQGYQESALDQSRVSHRGAVGIMQLLPSTAADPAVGIPDIYDADNNVHAGIRYMRWIRDTYFDDPAIDSRNQALFSFAAYNAGPSRVRGLRQKAAARGLDPNRWFRSVEIVAAEEIGRETVDYVAHIYKYFAAYRLLREREAARAEQ